MEEVDDNDDEDDEDDDKDKDDEDDDDDDDNDNDDDDEDEDDDDYRLRDDIHSFLRSDTFAPFLFGTELKYEEGGLQREKPELLITFAGSHGSKFKQQSVEFWGSQNCATKFKRVALDEELMKMGREALNKLQESEAFKKAEIEVTEPAWFLIISGF